LLKSIVDINNVCIFVKHKRKKIEIMAQSSYTHTSAINMVYYTDAEFCAEIKKEFYAMKKREGSSKYAHKSWEDHICKGSLYQAESLGLLDYRFTKKPKSYFDEKTAICIENYKIRAARIKATVASL